MYSFNQSLWEQLPAILGMTHEAFSVDILQKHKGYHYRKGSLERISVQEVIDSCNRANMSIFHLIVVDGKVPPIQERSHYVVPKEKFQPVSFNFSHWKDFYDERKERKSTSIQALSKEVGISYPSMLLYANRETFTIKMKVFIDICNAAGKPIDYFIDDPNAAPPASIPKDKDEHIRMLYAELKKKEQENSKLANENEALRKGMKELQSTSVRGMVVSEAETEYHRETSGSGIRPWAFNKELLSQLHVLKGLSYTVFYSAINRTNFGEQTKQFSEGNIYVEELLALLNHHGVSSRYFFYREGEKDEVSANVTFRDKDDHIDIRMDIEKLRDAFGPLSMSNILLKDALNEIGASKMKSKTFFRENSTLRVDDLAAFCNLIGVSPWAFIEDLNPGPAHHVTYAEALLEENRRLRGEIVGMKRTKKKG